MQTGVADLRKAGAKRSLGGLVRAGFELRGLVYDWRASLDDMLQRFLGDDEAAKFAVAANIAYYADDPRRMAWPFFAIAQGGFLKTGGVFVRGGSRTLSMKLARVVMKAGGTVLLGREAVGVDLDGRGRPAFVRHVDPRNHAEEERVGATQVFANCAPSTLAAMLPEPARAGLQRAYGGRALSTSLFSAHFGLNAPPARFGLERYGQMVLPDWMVRLSDFGACAHIFAADPGDKLPAFGIANYSAIDSGLADGGPALVSVVGIDRFDNWAALTPQEEKDRRERLARRLPGRARARLSRLWRRGDRAHVSQRPFDAQLPQHPRRRDLRLRAPAARARHLGGHSAIAQDAGRGPLPRLVLRRHGRLHRRDDGRRRGGAGGDGGEARVGRAASRMCGANFRRWLAFNGLRGGFCPPRRAARGFTREAALRQ